jgi:hypothetical protein
MSEKKMYDNNSIYFIKEWNPTASKYIHLYFISTLNYLIKRYFVYAT